MKEVIVWWDNVDIRKWLKSAGSIVVRHNNAWYNGLFTVKRPYVRVAVFIKSRGVGRYEWMYVEDADVRKEAMTLARKKYAELIEHLRTLDYEGLPMDEAADMVVQLESVKAITGTSDKRLIQMLQVRIDTPYLYDVEAEKRKSDRKRVKRDAAFERSKNEPYEREDVGWFNWLQD